LRIMRSPGCTGLVNVTIPNNVIVILARAFYGCTSLTSVTIGSGGYRHFSAEVFSSCASLTAITVMGSTPPIGTWRVSCSTRVKPRSSDIREASRQLHNPQQRHQHLGGRILCCTRADQRHHWQQRCSSFKLAILVGASRRMETSRWTRSTPSSAARRRPVRQRANHTHPISASKAGTYAVLSSVTNIGSGAFAHCTGLTESRSSQHHYDRRLGILGLR